MSNQTHTRALTILRLTEKNGPVGPKNSQVDSIAKLRARHPLSPRTAYISPTFRLHALALWPILILPAPQQPHSCSRLRPSPLRPNQQKKRLSPSKPPPRLPTAATPRRGSFTYPAAVTSTARPARCVSNPRKRPAATDTNPANAVWPARANRLWKFAGVLGRRKFRIKADHVSPLPQTCQHGPSLQSLSCVSPCSRPFPAQLAYGAGLSPQRPVSLRKTVTESRHPSLGPSDPEGSGVPSFLSLQLFSDRSAS